MKIRKFAIRVFVTLYAATVSANAANTHLKILDVRTPQEYSASHLKGAENIDFKSPDFRAKLEKMDRNQSYVLYCRTGNRSGRALELMKAMGFKDVKNAGGLHEAAKSLNAACEGKSGC